MALVTGGARRVGKAIAIELVRRGWRVVVHANRSADEAQAFAAAISAGVYGPGAAVAMTADLSEADAIEPLIRAAAGWCGRLDALVNSAAIWPRQSLEEATAADAQQCFTVNALAPFLLSRAAGLLMADQAQGGAILLLADIATRYDGRPYADHAAYHLSKAALPATVRTLAVELADRNPRIRVNAVAPGPVLCGTVPGEPAESSERVRHVRGAALVETGTAEGCGLAEHVAHAVAMLLENPFITGETLAVDGGGRLK
ncbi:Glucose 1-dehydrogenase 2 [Botrimarina hoheduenensis]|uniref:Glucose 1-dehydrogenase 2 n=1 Tax=Botrimarina hoheduenensis TaxID=2528000 RepID=A0A5C5W7B1_9BACT|nr:Glucose 1-dehydrogenase 2 [Botrimarina hoheduenensis]